MPEGEDGGAGDEVAGSDTGVGAVFVAEGEAKEADDEGSEGWDDGQGQALLRGVGRGHGSSLAGGADGLRPTHRGETAMDGAPEQFPTAHA
jgi:hypothetical protein